ncbi:MAG TPA: ATP-binding protein [Solirubrobacteraceae bacterium]|nr:ATP-binding protein [Solirubrobacteraceae bacterium]
MRPARDANAELDAVYPAQPAQIPQIRHAVADAAGVCGAGASTLAKIELAVSEAATNAVMHAYRDGLPQGDLSVLVRQADEFVDVSVRDSGVGMAPRPDSPGLGLGLSLMAHLADRLEIKAPPDGGTEILLRFQVGLQGA